MSVLDATVDVSVLDTTVDVSVLDTTVDVSDDYCRCVCT